MANPPAPLHEATAAAVPEHRSTERCRRQTTPRGCFGVVVLLIAGARRPNAIPLQPRTTRRRSTKGEVSLPDVCLTAPMALWPTLAGICYFRGQSHERSRVRVAGQNKK